LFGLPNGAGAEALPVRFGEAGEPVNLFNKQHVAGRCVFEELKDGAPR
jgi:hypothetical protein